MKKGYSKFLILIPLMFLWACQEEFNLDSNPPEPAEANFTYVASEENDNIIIFSSQSNSIKKWDFGNGQKGEGGTVTAVYPSKGSYTVTLTIYASGGSISSSQTIEIAETDPTLLDLPVYNFLTGGADQPEGKTWIIASTVAGHFGVGPNPSDPAFGDFPNYYAAGANEKEGGGLYNDKYTFILEDFKYIQNTEGDVYLNANQADKFPGAVESPVGDQIAPFTAPDDLTWSITTEGESDYIDISGTGFIGYYTGTSKYKIVSISETELFLRYLDSAAPDLSWYIRLVPEGFTPPPPPPPPPAETSTLPINFETVDSPFGGFGGSDFAVIANPVASGENTSSKVGETNKGPEVWAGILTTLEENLDFSVNNSFKMKVYSPKTGIVRFKLENRDDNTVFLEVDANITKVNEWEELTFDFSGAASDTYGKIAVFFDFGSTDQSKFYFDDIVFYSEGCDDEAQEVLNPAEGINFTVGSAFFGQFGNITAERVANPFIDGINTSCFVNSYGKTAGCETWSGTGYLLDNPIDFATATKKKFKLKVYAVDQVAEVTVRLERLAFPDTEPSAERTVAISNTGQWEELTFDFSDITEPNTYQNILVYFERGAACDGDQYYFDDLIQVE